MSASLFSFIPQQELVAFRAAYDGIAAQAGARVSANDARNVLVKSGLPNDVLGKIWTLVDTTGSGSLSMAEFILAMYLAARARSAPNPATAVPPMLPPSALQELSMANAQLSSLPGQQQQPQQQPQMMMPMHTGIPSLAGPMHAMSLANRAGTVSTMSTGIANSVVAQQQPPQMMNPAMTGMPPQMARGNMHSPMPMMQHAMTGAPAAAPPVAINAITIPGLMASMGPPLTTELGHVKWAITPAEKAKYDVMFRAWDTQSTGYLDSDKCREVFLTSGLPTNVLQHIWSLADVHNSGKLNADEFAVAMHLIYKKLNNIDLPTALPQELIPPSQRTLDTSVQQMKDQLMHKLLVDRAHAAASPAFLQASRSGAGGRGASDSEEANAYVSKHRRKGASAGNSVSNSVTGSVDDLAHSSTVDVHRQITLVREQIAEQKRKLAELAASSRHSDATMQNADDLKRQVRSTHSSVQTLERRYKSLKAEYNSHAASLRIYIWRVAEAMQTSPSGGNATVDAATKEQLMQLKNRVMQTEQSIAEAQFDIFKSRDAKSHKYAPLPRHLTAFMPTSGQSLSNLIPMSAAGSDPSRPLTEEEKIKQRAAQMLAERMAALTGKPSTSGTAAGASATLTPEQASAQSRIDAERERLKSLLKAREQAIDDLFAQLGLNSTGAAATSSASPSQSAAQETASVRQKLDDDKTRLSSVQDRWEQQMSGLITDENGVALPAEIRHLLEDTSSALSPAPSATSTMSPGSASPFAQRPPADNSPFAKEFTSVEDEIAALTGNKTVSNTTAAFKSQDYAGLLSSPALGRTANEPPSPSLGRKAVFPQYGASQATSSSSTTVAQQQLPPHTPDASSAFTTSRAEEFGAASSAAKEARLRAQEMEQKGLQEREQQQQQQQQSLQRQRSLKDKPKPNVDAARVTQPPATEVTRSYEPEKEKVQASAGSVKSLAASLFGPPQPAAAEKPASLRRLSDEWLSTLSSKQVPTSSPSTSTAMQFTRNTPVTSDTTVTSTNGSRRNSSSSMLDKAAVPQAPSASLINPFGDVGAPVSTPALEQQDVSTFNPFESLGGSVVSPGSDHAPVSQPDALFDDMFGAQPQSTTQAAPSFKVRALYDYPGSNEDDLSFNEGAVITVDPSQTDEEWYFGTDDASHRSGWFPRSYVESHDASTVSAPGDSSSGHMLYDYTANEDGELSVQEGDPVIIVDRSEPGWCKVTCNGRTGYVPASYVSVPDSNSATSHGFGNDQNPFGDAAEAVNPFTVVSPVQKRRSAPLVPPPSDAEILAMAPSGLRRKGSTHSTSNMQANVAPLWADNINPNLLTAISAEERKRQEAIFELICTEQSYVVDLQVVADVFIKPLRSHGLLSDDDTKDIFGNWEELLVANVALLSEFEARQAQDDYYIKCIGDVFLHHGQALEIYQDYCGRQMQGMQRLQARLKADEIISKFLKEAAADPRCKSFDLSSYLLKPLQRVTRYPLLLKQVLHYTAVDHEDHAQLLKAVHLSEDILNKANEAARAEETKAKMNEIVHKVDLTAGDNTLDLYGPTKVLGRRLLITEGPLQKAKSGRRLYAYLMNDLLLLIEEKRSARGYPFSLYRPPILLSRVYIDDKVSRDSPTFTIKFRGGDESIGLRGDSVSTANSWITKINKACADILAAENPKNARSTSSQQTVGTLKLTVVEGRQLHPLDPSISKLNLYCEVTVENQSERTKIIKGNSNPVWNQSLMFSVRNLDDKLRVVVYNQYDRYSQDDYMGTAEMEMHVLEYYGGKEVVQEFPLQNVPHGVLKVKLSYKSLMAH
ncbi:hypothetical protein RI367_005116 [Sorochytrium milnesiophthora]